ncbi:MAG: hypothetical protein Q7R83_02030 [bacterium]|nr:hypothetical protein [bacterium]
MTLHPRTIADDKLMAALKKAGKGSVMASLILAPKPDGCRTPEENEELVMSAIWRTEKATSKKTKTVILLKNIGAVTVEAPAAFIRALIKAPEFHLAMAPDSLRLDPAQEPNPPRPRYRSRRRRTIVGALPH